MRYDRRKRLRLFSFKAHEAAKPEGVVLPSGWTAISAEVANNGRVYVVAQR